MGGSSSNLSVDEVKTLQTESKYNHNEILLLHKEFLEMDSDKSGELDAKEFKVLFKKRMPSITDVQLERMFTAFDTDQSKTVNFKELVVALSVLSRGTVEDKLHFLFTLYDVDKSGFLTREEAKQLLEQVKNAVLATGVSDKAAEAFAEQVWKKLDPNADGNISHEEWVSMGKRVPSLMTLLGE